MARLLPLFLLMACKTAQPDPPSKGTDTEPAVDSESPSPTDSEPMGSDSPTDAPPGPTDTDPVVDLCALGDGVIGNLTQVGTSTILTDTGSHPFGSCSMTWTRYHPADTPHDAFVVLAHGFQRSPAQVRGWAEHLASWGFEVYTPALCHSTILDVDHLANGLELASLAEALHPGRSVIFAGHSAGGLAAVVAGGNDRNALGVFGLDLVDNADLGENTATSTSIPIWGLKGDNSLCNSSGNGRNVYNAAPDGRFYKIDEATHCDFEDPTDLICTLGCPGPLLPNFDDAAQRRAIQAMMTGYALWLSGADPDGRAYWEPGCAPFDAFAGGGLVR